MNNIYVIRANHEGNIAATTSLTRALQKAEHHITNNTLSGITGLTYFADGEDQPYTRKDARKIILERNYIDLYSEDSRCIIEIQLFRG